MKNGIYLVATPIGNVQDITLRALEVLKSADIIACEDTRVTKKLFSLLNLSTLDKKFIPLHDHNESTDSLSLITAAQNGHVIAYVSDAGSPLISDPGYKLARIAKENDVYLTTIPGACAAICALQLSGLPSNNFTFCGFIPNKDKARHDFLQKYAAIDSTLIFYERADRLLKTLSAMQDLFCSREIAVARELTKIYEECQTGSLAEVTEHYTLNPPKGEIVLMVSPPCDDEKSIDYTTELRDELKKAPLKTAVKIIVEKYHLSRSEVYQKALELKDNE